MFPMTPLQSWAFLVLLVVLAVLIVQLARQVGSKTLDVLETGQGSEDTHASAEVRVLHPRPQRHLRAVPPGPDTEDDSDPLAVWRDVLES